MRVSKKAQEWMIKFGIFRVELRIKKNLKCDAVINIIKRHLYFIFLIIAQN